MIRAKLDTFGTHLSMAMRTEEIEWNLIEKYAPENA